VYKWLAQFVCAPQFFITPKGLCGQTVSLPIHTPSIVTTLNRNNVYDLILEIMSTTILPPLWIFLIILSGVRLSPLGTAVTTGQLYQPQMTDDGDWRAICGIKIGRGKWSTRRKASSVTLCPPQIPHDQIRARNRAASVGSQRLNLLSYGASSVASDVHLHLIFRTLNRFYFQHACSNLTPVGNANISTGIFLHHGPTKYMAYPAC
jgi:hypothetical protein